MTELKKYKMFIDGEWVESDTKKTFETLNPENNKKQPVKDSQKWQTSLWY